MHIRDFFHIPADKKISEKAFTRVLISSICGMLLCMCCLAGTTWAWFVASVENPNNVITIATVTAQATILQGQEEVAPDADGGYTLPTGTYTLLLSVENDATTAQPVFVLLTVTKNGVDTAYYRTFTDASTATITVTVEDGPITVQFATRWAQPVALPLTDTLSDSEVQVPVTDTTTTTTLPSQDVTADKTTTVTEVTDTTTTVTESTTTTEVTDSTTAEDVPTTALPTTETTEVIATTEATEVTATTQTQPTDLTEE